MKILQLATLLLAGLLTASCTKIEGLGIVEVYPSYMNKVQFYDQDGNEVKVKSLNRDSIDVALEAGLKDDTLYMVPGKNMEPVNLLLILDLPKLPKYELMVQLNEKRPTKLTNFTHKVTVFTNLDSVVAQQ